MFNKKMQQKESEFLFIELITNTNLKLEKKVLKKSMDRNRVRSCFI